jgi:hypothetical protein
VSSALERIPVGVVVERRKALSPWIDFTWKPLSVLVGVPEASPWTKLSGEDETAAFYAGMAEIELHRTETANYRNNLAGDGRLWVSLRPTGIDPPYEVFGVTADPAEGEGWTETGADLVDVVAMPDPVRAVIEAFVTEHHVERPFYKRKRDRADPEALGRRPPAREDRKE